MVGSAINRQLSTVPGIEIMTRTRAELDLTNQAAVERFFAENTIDEVYLAAAKVGGIYANESYPAEFLYENLMIEANVINMAFKYGVRKLIFFGSSCIYPRLADQPIREEALLTGSLEQTNEPYAVAKIAGVKLCESYNRQYQKTHGIDYRSIMPANLYGPGDNYHPENSHVIPALIRKFHDGKVRGLPEVIVWGSGQPKREFLHVDDAASASIHVMNLPSEAYYKQAEETMGHINVGFGSDVSIAELASHISEIIGYRGKIIYDRSKPDGTPRKLMDSSRINALGWQASIPLNVGLKLAYHDFLQAGTRLDG